MSDKVLQLPIIDTVQVVSADKYNEVVVDRDKYRQQAVFFEDELFVTTKERDRFQKVLEKIAAMPLSASWQHNFFDAVKMAQEVLPGAKND